MPKIGTVTRIRIWQAIPLAVLLVCTSPVAVLAQSELDRRLIDQGDATPRPDGRVPYRRNLIAMRQEREIARAGAELAAAKPIPFRAAADGETVSGTFTGTVQLSSSKFAIVEKSHEFTLVPWRQVIDHQIGREITGIVQGGSVSWQLGRQRGLEL